MPRHGNTVHLLGNWHINSQRVNRGQEFGALADDQGQNLIVSCSVTRLLRPALLPCQIKEAILIKDGVRILAFLEPRFYQRSALSCWPRATPFI